MSSTTYIWTTHALKRIGERKIPQSYIKDSLAHPDIVRTKKNKTILQKRIDQRTLKIIVTKNEKRENIIVSCWINPPFPGTKDYRRRKRYFARQHASFGKKLWLWFLDLIDR